MTGSDRYKVVEEEPIITKEIDLSWIKYVVATFAFIVVAVLLGYAFQKLTQFIQELQRQKREEERLQQQQSKGKNKKHKKTSSTDGFDIPEFPGDGRKPNQRKRYLQPVVDQTAIDILLNEEGSISKKERLRNRSDNYQGSSQNGLAINLEKLPQREEYDENSYRKVMFKLQQDEE